MFKNIRIILVDTTHPGNIGSTARAMKTMGFSDLYLVNPKYFPHGDATALASGADDILTNAIVVDSLDEAIKGCHYIWGTSARIRGLAIPLHSPRECAAQINEHHKNHQIAIIFGREHSGLTNEELEKCHYHVYIDANPEYSSLNLAQAAQIICYELRLALLNHLPLNTEIKRMDQFAEETLASADQTEGFYQHFFQTLKALDFIDDVNRQSLERRIRRLFNRSHLYEKEIHMLRGIFRAIDRKIHYSLIPTQQKTENNYTNLKIINSDSLSAPAIDTKKSSSIIYLDYMATTPVDPHVAARMQHYLTMEGIFANPASTTHALGVAAHQAISEARHRIAQCIHAPAAESIIFTSGATEANNLAIKGIAHFYQRSGRHLITCETEHHAVLDCYRALEQEGFRVTYLKPLPNGLINLTDLQQAVTSETILISVMHVNNEIGVIQPIAEIGAWARQQHILFHVDAAQSAGKLPINVQAMNTDLLSLSAHKFYGPKGVGCLYIRQTPRIHLTPLIHGGGHERGLRSGTLATHQIIGMAEALDLAEKNRESEYLRIQNYYQTTLNVLESITDVIIHGDISQRVPHNLNFTIKNIQRDQLLKALNAFAISTRSACTTDSLQPSHVLKALNAENEIAQNAIRISFGRFTRENDVELFLNSLRNAVNNLRNS